MTELKPCPNPACRSVDGLGCEVSLEMHPGGERSYWGQCTCCDCDTAGPTARTHDRDTAEMEAIAAWNALPRSAWIPVSERMPVIGQTYPVFVADGEYSDWACATFDRHGNWWLEGDCFRPLDKVTHYMIPDPPEVE